jgi:hypothetical protein
MTVKLIYIGRGDAFYNVPARDLTDEDLAERAELWQEYGITESLLVASGLYEKVKTEQPKTKKAAKEGE